MRRAKSASAPLLPASAASHTARKAHHCTSDKPSAASPQIQSLRIANTQNALFLAYQHDSSAPTIQATRATSLRIYIAAACLPQASFTPLLFLALSFVALPYLAVLFTLVAATF